MGNRSLAVSLRFDEVIEEIRMPQMAGSPVSQTRGAMHWKARKRSDQKGAGRTVPRRERRPSRRFRRPDQKRRCAGSVPSPATCSCHRGCRTTSEVPKITHAHPEWRRVPQMSGSGVPARPVVRQADPLGHSSRNRSARGVRTENVAPCFSGALRGAPVEGAAGDSKVAPGQGKASPP